MELEWNLRYARWVIEDGQPDLHVGETLKWFAVAFGAEDPLVRTTVSKSSAFPVDDYRYRVVAQLTYLSESACIIDFGLKQHLLLAYYEPDANRAIAPESSVLVCR